MSGYPEWLPHGAICHMEGHEWRDGGVCVFCGERLRCDMCGCFVRVDGLDAHMSERHPMPCSEDCDGCEKCYPVGVTE